MSFLGRLFGSAAGAATDVDAQAAQALVQRGAVLVDVRQPGEFRGGHAAGARNIPLGQLANRAGELKKDGTVLVICASGNRSKAGRGILQRLEFSDVRNVVGGTSAWQRAGLPMKR